MFAREIYRGDQNGAGRLEVQTQWLLDGNQPNEMAASPIRTQVKTIVALAVQVMSSFAGETPMRVACLYGHAQAYPCDALATAHIMTHRLTRTTLLSGTLADVFAFFKNPRNLESITPPWLGFRITYLSDDTVREGSRIRYRLNLHGIPISWESRIAEYVEDSSFADEQIAGPYSLWYHRHVFRAIPGGVEMTDDVQYRLPFGPVGRLVHWLVVRHQLARIFEYRATAIRKWFPTPESARHQRSLP